MIELTVKTLDSQDHSFSLDDDITVRAFKEYIAESVAVPADSQRLIYCGRVLQDDKKLNDYNVNGKVIHLVQRAPPQPGQRGNDAEQRQNTTQNPNHIHRTHYRVIRDINLHNAHPGPNAQVHGNTMYLGAMTLPTEVVEGHSLPLPQLSNTLSNSRMIMAENMLTNANRILDRLYHPQSASPDMSNERQSTSSTDNSNSPSQSSRSASGSSGANRRGPAFRSEVMLESTVKEMLEMAGCRMIVIPPEDSSEDAEAPSSNDSPSGAASQQDDPFNLIFPNNAPPSLSDRLRAPPTEPRPPQMANLLVSLTRTQDRLRPFLDRYRVLMETDPVLSATGTDFHSVSASQMIVNEVSRILHYLAHANHALSDIIVDLSQAPPRNLSCRPIIIQQSAILQAGIPIQVEAHISVNEGNARANRTETNGSTQTPTETPDYTENRESSAQERPNQQHSSGSHQRFDHQQNSDQPPRTEQQRNQTPLGNLFSSVFNLPSNVEVLMEVSPDSSMDLNSADEQGSNNAPNSNESRGNQMGRGASWMFPPGAPPTDFIRNLMHAVAGHIVQDPSAMTSNQSGSTMNMPQSQPTIGVTIDSNGQNSGQSTQARNNVGTHPTTSTQTRSTARPHVFHPNGIGLASVSDPFLPCNSHHLRRLSSPGANRNQSQQNAKHINGDRFLQMLHRNLPSSHFTANRDAFAYTLRKLIQIVFNGEIEVRFSNEIPASVTSGITLANLMEIPVTAKAEDNLIFDLTLLIARSALLEDVFGLPWGFYNIFSSLRKPLREFIKEKTNSMSSTDQFVDLLLDCLRPSLRRNLLSKKVTNAIRTDASYDILGSVENVFRRNLIKVVKLFCSKGLELNNVTFVEKAELIFEHLILEFCNVLLYLFNGSQLEFSIVVKKLLTDLAADMFPTLSKWVLTKLINKINRSIVDFRMEILPQCKILSLLVKTDSSDQNSAGSCTTHTPSMSKPVESLNAEDTIFPGHEILPPDWVPTIALDGASQRRSAPSMQAGGIPNFSDAYLGCLPCKRRKIIEQEKLQLLANPTSNHSTISASIERMVRESASRTGVAEVEGAAVAVANDSGVRTAFSKAIQDYGNGIRSTDEPDFPNSERFPNATKFFCEDARR